MQKHQYLLVAHIIQSTCPHQVYYFPHTVNALVELNTLFYDKLQVLNLKAALPISSTRLKKRNGHFVIKINFLTNIPPRYTFTDHSITK